MSVQTKPREAASMGFAVEYVPTNATFGPWPERFGTPRGSSRSRRLRMSESVTDFTNVVYRYPKSMQPQAAQ